MGDTVAGLVVVAVLLVLAVALLPGGRRALRRFGRLPGDVRVERPGLRMYLPITSMILIGVVASLLLAVAGPLLALLGGAVSWFGRLPGDVRIERSGFRMYLPITSMVLLSAAATVAMNLVAHLRRHHREEEPPDEP